MKRNSRIFSYFRELLVGVRQYSEVFELALELPVELKVDLDGGLTVITGGHKTILFVSVECIHLYELEWYRVVTCVSMD